MAPPKALSSHVRFAFFNVENLFSRPRAFQERTLGDDILRAYARLQLYLQAPDYGAIVDGKRVSDHVFDLMWRTESYQEYRHLAGPRRLHNFVEIRVDRGPGGNIFHTGRGEREPKGLDFDFTGRGVWTGAAELIRVPMASAGVDSLARVIKGLDADVLGVAEVESRRTVEEFNRTALGGLYDKVLVIEGNDRRGIDVGLLVKAGVEIGRVRTNVFTRVAAGPDAGLPLFDRDLLEVEVVGRGWSVVAMVTHLKSKRGSAESERASDPRRLAQSGEIARIASSRYRRDGRWTPLVLMGDLNETPDRAGANGDLLLGGETSIDPILRLGAEGLESVLPRRLPRLDDRWTTWFSGGGSQIDHLFASAPVAERIVAAGIDRSGVFVEGRPDLSGVASDDEAASDHAAVWMDVAW